MEKMIKNLYKTRTSLGTTSVMVVDESAGFSDLLKQCENEREKELAYGLIAYERLGTSEGVLAFYQILLHTKPTDDEEIEDLYVEFMDEDDE